MERASCVIAGSGTPMLIGYSDDGGRMARERQMDFRRRGVAIVVDPDRVEGRDSGGRFLMVRD